MKDAIIVLAGGINEDGSLSISSERRTEKAAEFFKEGVSEWLVMSGQWSFWLEKPMPRTEAEAMKQYAVTLGIPAHKIIKEESSKDTLGNAYFCKVNVLKPREWKDIAIVTSDYHMERTKMIFKNILGKDYRMDFIEASSDLDPVERARRADQERKTIDFIASWFQKMGTVTDEKVEQWLFEKHPGYAPNSGITKEQMLKNLGRIE